jgi:hypothetical protein
MGDMALAQALALREAMPNKAMRIASGVPLLRHCPHHPVQPQEENVIVGIARPAYIGSWTRQIFAHRIVFVAVIPILDGQQSDSQFHRELFWNALHVVERL